MKGLYKELRETFFDCSIDQCFMTASFRAAVVVEFWKSTVR